MRLLISLFFIFTACTHKPTQNVETKDSNKIPLVLIHGIHLNAESWKPFEKEVSQQYEILKIDLKEEYASKTPSLQKMAEKVCSLMTKPSLVAAHGFGGAVSSQMTSFCPGKIRQLIFISAWIPQGQDRALTTFNPMRLNSYSQQIEVRDDLIHPKNGTSFHLTLDKQVEIGKHVELQLNPVSVALFKTQLKLNEQNFNQIPKAFIYAEFDRLNSIDHQIQFTSRVPMTKTASLNAGHLIMITRPITLAKSFKKVAL